MVRGLGLVLVPGIASLSAAARGADAAGEAPRSAPADARPIAKPDGVPAPRQDAGVDQKQVCIAAAEQGQTQRDDGQYRAARGSFVACAADVCPRVIAQSCTKWLRELDESAPTVVLDAKDEQSNDLTDVRVTLDGAPFATVLDGKPIEVDTGEHVFRFEREGSVPVEQRVLLRAGERARVVGATLRPFSPPAAGSATGSEDAAGSRPREPVLSPHHVVAGSLAIGALATTAVGLVFIVESGGHKNDASALRGQVGGNPSACATTASAPCQALSDKVHAQYADQNAGTAFFIGAGALAAAAIVSWFAWPQPSAAQTTGTIVALPGGAGVQINGRF